MQIDADLKQLFSQELSERARKLVEGAQRYSSEENREELARSMYREGHTVKGTARVMGFSAIGDAGLLLETTWRSVQSREIDFTPELGESLEALAAAVPTAIGADPEDGSPQLRAAMAALTAPSAAAPDAEAPAAEVGEEAAEAEDQSGPESAESVEIGPPPDPFAGAGEPLPVTAESSGVPITLEREQEPANLGGLVASIESWAVLERTTVSTADLYRLVNAVAALDVDVQALVRTRDDDPDGFADTLSTLTSAAADAKQLALNLAAAPLSEITSSLPQLVAYLARRLDRDVRLEILGEGITIDRQVLDHLANPLRHLVANAVQHGIEPAGSRQGKSATGLVLVRADREGETLVLSVEDDGAGVDWPSIAERAGSGDTSPDVLQAKLFEPGFGIGSGQGNGLATVAGAIGALSGGLSLETREGGGTVVTMRVPVARALQTVVLVAAGGHTWGIPDASVVAVAGEASDAPEPVKSFAGFLGLSPAGAETETLVVSTPRGPETFAVDAVLGRRNVAVKELGPILDSPGLVSSAALLGGGEVVLLVDPMRSLEDASPAAAPAIPRPQILIVDDSPGARDVVAAALVPAGFDTRVASSAEEALAMLLVSPADAMVVDFSMPGLDGIELVKVVRSKFEMLPIVMLSAVADSGDQVAAKEAGVDAFFKKDDLRRGGLAAELTSLVAERAGP